MPSTFRLLASLTVGIALPAAASFAQAGAPESGLIGRRYAGADFNYDHFSGSAIDYAMGATGVVNLPVASAYDVGLTYSYMDTSGAGRSGIDKLLGASVLTHRATEYGTGYFAAMLGHQWNGAHPPGLLAPGNTASWGVRAGYEIPLARGTALNAGVGYADAFSHRAAQASVWRYQLEANHWFSRDVTGVLGVAYKQIKASPDAISYTLGLRCGF
jgi:hypothetical protein